MKITQLITKGRMLLILKQILSTIHKEMYGDQSEEFVCGSWGFKG